MPHTLHDIGARRSIRRYRREPIPRATLEQI